MINALPLSVDCLQIVMQWKEKFETDIKSLVGYPVEVVFKLKPAETVEAALQTCICETFDLPWTQVIKKSRKTEIVEARHTYCYFASVLLNKGLKQIAEDVGFTHHTTVINSRQTVKDWIDTDLQPYKSKFLKVKSKFYHEVEA